MKHKKAILWVAAILILLVLAFFGLMRLGVRNGVTDAQVQEPLPGDDVIANPLLTVDRAVVLPVAAEQAWPWVIQLGKDRAGWYAPLWLENALNLHAASSTLPEYQNLALGEVVPDWGGGSLKVLDIKPNQYVLYSSQHSAATSTPGIGFTWLLILENDTPMSTTLHLRLRLPRAMMATAGIGRFIPPQLGGIIDYAADIVMFAGLKERLEQHRQ